VKFPLSWIRDFVQPPGTAGELAAALTAVGLPVETVTTASDGDAIFDIEVFPNRPDCLSVYGVARELAAATRAPLAPPPAVSQAASGQSAAARAKVSIEAADLCGRYVALLLNDVRVGPSPEWVVSRLIKVGLRPINNIVDATNYALWELGHPLHAFDLDKLSGPEIRVRLARPGETIVTLDGVRRTTRPGMLMIADATRCVAVAGVMGGAETMVTEATSSILLESAHFSAPSVRRTARALSLPTDASYRFERGADIELCAAAAHRGAALILKAAGGKLQEGMLEARPAPPVPRRITLRPERVAMLVGTRVETTAMTAQLAALQFQVAPRGASLEVTVPSHRLDVLEEVDLIEEVARSTRYDAIPERLPVIQTGPGEGGVHREGHRMERAIRRALHGAGCHEAVSGSFLASALQARMEAVPAEALSSRFVAVTNPISADADTLRASLLPGLLSCVAHNVNRGARDLRVFEIGHVFRPAAPGAACETGGDIGIIETVSLGIVLTGDVRPKHYLEPARAAAIADLRGLIEAALAEAGHRASCLPAAARPPFQEGRTGMIRAGASRKDDATIGWYGALDRRLESLWDLRQEVLAAEIDMTALCGRRERTIAFQPLPRYPAVSRDLSLVIPRGRLYGEIEEAVREAAAGRIVTVRPTDQYSGPGLPEGTYGLSINLVYQSAEGTLSSEEINDLQGRVTAALSRRCGAALRQ